MTRKRYRLTTLSSKDVKLIVLDIEANKYQAMLVQEEEYENSVDHEELENRYYDYLDQKLTAMLEVN
jgi:hypothetical protein